MKQHSFHDGNCRSKHTGDQPVRVGDWSVRLASSIYVTDEALMSSDIILPLNGEIPRHPPFGHTTNIAFCELVDFGGVPDNWEEFIWVVRDWIVNGFNVLAWCTGSHGRTGTLYASLLAVMEPDCDPIATARERHCKKAVETVQQAKAVFALKREPLPEIYRGLMDRSALQQLHTMQSDKHKDKGFDAEVERQIKEWEKAYGKGQSTLFEDLF